MSSDERHEADSRTPLTLAADVLEAGRPCAVLDAAWRYVYVNQGYEQLSGKPRRDLLGRSMWDVFPDAASPALKFWSAYQQVQRDRVPAAFEEYYPPMDLWVEVDLQPVGTEYVAAFHRPINPRKQAEARLRESEARFRQLAETMPQLMWLIHADGKTDYANDRWREYTGLSLEQGAGWLELIHPDERPETARRWQEAVRTGGPYSMELRLRRARDGAYRWFLAQCLPVRENGGRIERWLGTATDIQEQKDAAQAARQSEKRLRLFIDHAPAAVAVYDREMRHLAVSRRYLRDYRAGDVDVIGRSVYEVFPKTERWREIHRHCLAGHVERAEEDTFLHADGTQDWVRWELRPWYLDSGEIGGLILLSEIITARKKADEALRASVEAERRSSALLRLVADTIPDLVFVKDLESRFLLVNPATLTAIGKSAEGETLGRNNREVFMDAQEAAAVMENDRRIMRTNRAEVVEENVSTPRGRRIFLATKAPLRDDRGRVIGLVGVARDITERKQAEEALLASEEELRRAIDEAPIPIILHAEDGEVLQTSRSWTELTGYTREDIPSLDAWLSRAYGAGAQEMREHIRSLFSGSRREVGVELPIHTRSGQERRWSVSTSRPGRLRDGRRFVVTMAVDVTERRAAEAALRTANEHLREMDQRKNEFLAMLSHELRNPLAPIRNSVYILERTAPGSEQARRARQVIDRQTQHLTRLVDDLLDVTRISRGKINLQRESVELQKIVHGVAEDHRDQFARNGIEFELQVDEQPLRVWGDATRLAQAVGNLLNNAAKFTSSGGRVRLVLESAPGEAVIRVQDTGAGISREMLPRLFQPFAQGDRSLDRSRGGLGLGLALVKGLAELHGGTVSASSAGPGHGSEFVLHLPLEDRSARALTGREPPARTSRARRVLIIEDNPDAAESLKEVVELAGHTAEVAHTGPEGIAMARRCPPEVVLCDVGLPDMDGYQVAHAFRGDTTLDKAVLVALTGYASPEDKEHAIRAGFDSHVAKPVDPCVLERILSQSGDGSALRLKVRSPD